MRSIQILPAAELRLADVIECAQIHAYSTATVKRIQPSGEITLFRPYVQPADFSMGESVICYIGFEEWTFTPRPGDTFRVLERRDLK